MKSILVLCLSFLLIGSVEAGRFRVSSGCAGGSCSPQSSGYSYSYQQPTYQYVPQSVAPQQSPPQQYNYNYPPPTYQAYRPSESDTTDSLSSEIKRRLAAWDAYDAARRSTLPKPVSKPTLTKASDLEAMAQIIERMKIIADRIDALDARIAALEKK